MLWGSHPCGLELRTEGGETRLRASFPYNRETVLADGAQPRKEIIASRAFADRVEQGHEIHFLLGHDYGQPLASTRAGTLTLKDTSKALEIEATITGNTSWARDFLSAHESGLIRGLSPGFRVKPGGEVVEARDGAILRTIRGADLFEISAVSVPAYPLAQIEARCWETHQDRKPYRGKTHHLNRWRL
jgi:HK97 family phage prohead protease